MCKWHVLLIVQIATGFKAVYAKWNVVYSTKQGSRGCYSAQAGFMAFGKGLQLNSGSPCAETGWPRWGLSVSSTSTPKSVADMSKKLTVQLIPNITVIPLPRMRLNDDTFISVLTLVIDPGTRMTEGGWNFADSGHPMDCENFRVVQKHNRITWEAG